MWTHTALVFLCLVCFTEHNVFSFFLKPFGARPGWWLDRQQVPPGTELTEASAQGRRAAGVLGICCICRVLHFSLIGAPVDK